MITRGISKGLVSAAICLSTICSGVLAPRAASAEPIREFVLSAGYGVLAGGLVGAATLAFSDKPGENLNRIARGASIGLYAGIALGLYVVYGVPGDDVEEIMVLNLPDGSQDSDGSQLSSQRLQALSSRSVVKMIEPPRFTVAPVLGERGIEGAAAQMNLLRF